MSLIKSPPKTQKALCAYIIISMYVTIHMLNLITQQTQFDCNFILPMLQDAPVTNLVQNGQTKTYHCAKFDRSCLCSL